jgi:hypothetical protein
LAILYAKDNPVSQFLPDWLPVITVLIALAALLVAIWAQLRTQDAQRALQRPILILDERSIALYQLDGGGIDWEKSFNSPNSGNINFRLGLINVGAGLATRIEGVFFGPDDPIFLGR